MVNGTSMMRASVCASSVLPQPVGPISRMFDFASSTSLFFAGVREALVVVVDGDRQHALGVGLADHVVVENLQDLLRGRHAVARLHHRGLVLLADDVHAQFDAFIADEHRRAGDQLADLVLALAAERAVERVLGVAAAVLLTLLIVSKSFQCTPADRSGRAPTCSISRGKPPLPAQSGTRNAFRTKHKSENVAMIRDNPVRKLSRRKST